MPRVSLSPRNRYLFATEIVVRTTDLNYGGHLGNDRFLSLAHEARVAFLAAHGWTEQDCAGTSLLIGDAALLYLAEAFAGDVLRFEVVACEPRRAGFRLAYRITRPEDSADVALVETGMVSYDHSARRTRTLPKAVRAICLEEEVSNGSMSDALGR